MINKALKQIRLFHRYKQDEMAQKVGISKSYLCQMEKGNRNISINILQGYADVFGMPISSLIYFSEQLEKQGEHSVSFRVKKAGLIQKMLEEQKLGEE